MTGTNPQSTAGRQGLGGKGVRGAEGVEQGGEWGGSSPSPAYLGVWTAILYVYIYVYVYV